MNLEKAQTVFCGRFAMMIIRDVLGYNEFYKVYFEKDKTINRALESLNTNEYKSLINSMNNGQKGN